MPKLDELGREIFDQTPMAIPVGFSRPEPIHIRLRRMVERYHQDMKDSQEYESFDEADDFDVGDGAPSFEDAPTEYEANFMPHESPVQTITESEKSPSDAGGGQQGSPADAPAEPAE